MTIAHSIKECFSLFFQNSTHNSLALALLPAIAVGCGRGPLESAVVISMTGLRALRAAAQRIHQRAITALVDVSETGENGLFER